MSDEKIDIEKGEDRETNELSDNSEDIIFEPSSTEKKPFMPRIKRQWKIMWQNHSSFWKMVGEGIKSQSKENIQKSKNVINEMGKTWKSARKWISSVFAVEDALNKVYKTPENEEEERMIKKIRKINLWEFIITLSLVFGTMWTLWWIGIITDNPTMEMSGYVVIGLVGIWGLLISPFYHYFLERGYTYRPGYLGLDYEQNYFTAWFEERGFGSLRKHWEINLKDKKSKKLVSFMSLFVLFTIILVLLDDIRYLYDFAKLLSLNESQQLGASITALVWAYQLVAILMLVRSVKVAGGWKNTGSLDKTKKFLLVLVPSIIAFLGIWLTWGYAIRNQADGTWVIHTEWKSAALFYQETMKDAKSALFVVIFFLLMYFGYLLLKYFGVGVLIRFDNLKSAAKQFLFVSIIATIIILAVFGILTSPGLQPYIIEHNKNMMDAVPYGERLWYIFDSTAIEDWNKASFFGFMGNWAGYIYWGLIQEWLFLGYWCTLLTKGLKNKYAIALLSSLCFGLIHFPSWPLMIFTMAGGYFWALAWIDGERYRNLFIFGMIHGFAGTLVARLIPITMSVGPSNMG